MVESFCNFILRRRLPVLARRGVVATSEPLAAQAGLWILQQGGNAVDAAIATAAALTVVEPTCNGVGGDAFALVWVLHIGYLLNLSLRQKRLADELRTLKDSLRGKAEK